ncbi:MAG: ATP-binding cassette domain-containing protein [Xanthobacteraceae bacterium]|uniref:ATP-binding cassette domain-containing protein n=1 Tax=Pseudolabrys sp. TaxID=1960880 RepID=UPI003D0A4E85
MTDSPLLQVRDLAITYYGGGSIIPGRRRSFDAVKGVSFDIAAGQGFALVGESGSGKTTIGRAILRLVTPSRGSIVFDGQDVTAFGRRTPLSFRRDVQVVFQDPRSSLNPRRTVRDTLMQVLKRHFGVAGAQAAAQAAELLDQVGLPSYHLNRYPGELSGGQQQRVAIARALAPKPRLLVCDEPVSALDVSTQSQILNLLADLRRDLNLAYLFISHDLAVVRQVADIVAVMHRGVIVETGPTETLYTQPAAEYTKILLASVPSLEPRRRARDAEIPGVQ